MRIRIHPHAHARMIERGATAEEVFSTIQHGDPIPAKFNRKGFRRNFHFDGLWRNHRYQTKQLEVFAVEDGGWLVITVLVKYF